MAERVVVQVFFGRLGRLLRLTWPAFHWKMAAAALVIVVTLFATSYISIQMAAVNGPLTEGA